jgi:hypothetical protein
MAEVRRKASNIPKRSCATTAERNSTIAILSLINQLARKSVKDLHPTTM